MTFVWMTLIFAVLKIGGQVDWPWIFVISPLLLSVALDLLAGLVVWVFRE